MTASETPYGYCHCGCGQKTKVCAKTNHARGHVKGKPQKWVRGHQSKWQLCPKCGFNDKYKDGTCRNCRAVYRDQNRELASAVSKEWRKNNKENRSPEAKLLSKIRVSARRRSMRYLSKEQILHIIWCQQQPCTYCGGVGGTHDHIISLARGGTWDITNIVPACRSCNSSKQDKLLEEWRPDA